MLEVTSTQSGRRKRLDDSVLTGLFDFETGDESSENVASVALSHMSMSVPERLTGQMILEKRKALQLNQSDFAQLVGVSIGSVSSWESKRKKIVMLQAESLKKVQAIW